MSYFNMVSHNPPAIMVSIQCANKNPDGLKGVSSLYGTAELTERYQFEHQEHQGILRFYYL